MAAERRAGSRRRGGAVALGLTMALLAGCGSDPVDPSVARRERLEKRLRSSFTKEQASCILGRLDESVLRALDRSTDLRVDDEAFLLYSAALQTCVDRPAVTTATTTTSGPRSTTTAG